MRFSLSGKRDEESFSVIYREEEYSFDLEPTQESGYASIMINNLHLEVSHSGDILYPWGVCPLLNCEETSRQPENFCRSKLKVSLDETLTPGVSYRLCSSERWTVLVNKKTNWVCIGDSNFEGRKVVEFAPNCVASLDRGNLKALWICLNHFPYDDSVSSSI